MVTQESTLIDFNENEFPALQPVASLQVVSTPYLHDLKNTLEFDRRCRALETLLMKLGNA